MKNIHTSGKRKSAIARAVVKQGTGIVRLNSVPIDLVEPRMSRLKLMEPLILAGDVAGKVNIDVSVIGGGISSQAEASRLAIAKTLLVAEVRRKEPSKPNRHGQARSKVQKSYR